MFGAEAVDVGGALSGYCGDDGLAVVHCHGGLGGDDPGLPSCPNQALCDRIPGPDLGEVSIKVEGAESLAAPIRIDDGVTQVAFRKPRGGLLRAARTLALIGGGQLLFDDSDLKVLVVSPNDTEEDLEPVMALAPVEASARQSPLRAHR